MPTSNMGLTIPIGGVTPGAANNVTVGSYPYIWLNNLNLIDSEALSIPNNPAKVSNGGIVIDGNLNFGGFGLTNASTGAFSSNMTIGGTLGVTGVSTLTGGIGSSLTIGTSLFNNVTIAGKATGVDPTITVAGDATRSVNVVVPLATANTIGGLGISPVGGAPVFIGSDQAIAAGGACLWLGSSASTATGTNWTVFSNLTVTALNAATTLDLSIGGSAEISLTAGAFTVNAAIPISMGVAATALTLKGNAAATGAIGIVLTNQTQQTSGTSLAIQNPTGTGIATVDFAGTISSATGKFEALNGATGLTLEGTVASGGAGLTITNSLDIGATGYIALFSAQATSEFAITGRGHLIPLSTAPAAPIAASFAAGFQSAGAVSAITLTGSDAAMILKFTTGTGCTQITEQTSLIGTITLAQGYSSSSFAAFAAFASEPTNVSTSYGINDTAPLIVVPLSASTFALYAAIPFTPKLSTAYAITIFTMGAGATS